MRKPGRVYTHKLGRQQLEAADRRRKVTAMYLARMTQRQIAEQLGIHQTTVSLDIAAIKKEYLAERTALIDREVMDLEAMEKDCATRYVTEKSVDWIHARLAVKKRRAEMLGLDAAKRVTLGLLSDGTRLDDLSDDELLDRYRLASAGSGDRPPKALGPVIDAKE